MSLRLEIVTPAFVSLRLAGVTPALVSPGSDLISAPSYLGPVSPGPKIGRLSDIKGRRAATWSDLAPGMLDWWWGRLHARGYYGSGPGLSLCLWVCSGVGSPLGCGDSTGGLSLTVLDLRQYELCSWAAPRTSAARWAVTVNAAPPRHPTLIMTYL